MNNNDMTGRLSPKIKMILDAELSAGNELKEISETRFTEQDVPHIFVFLKKEFMSDMDDIEGLRYALIDDRHYWKAEYYDAENHQIIACNFND